MRALLSALRDAKVLPEKNHLEKKFDRSVETAEILFFGSYSKSAGAKTS